MALKMKFRRNILPTKLSEIGAFVFVLAMIPATYCFELFVVLPEVYPVWSLWYTIHFVCGNFLMVNVTSNFVATVTTDTSIAGEIMPSTLTPGWRFCSVCETVVPPRSWHCDVCKTCILKRDHHCMFTGCCIGHYNHRFFFMFIVYMLISTVYSTYFNNHFIWHNVDFTSPVTFFKILFPMAMFFFGLDASVGQFYLTIYLINVVGLAFTFALVCIHFDLIIKGRSQFEKNRRVSDYNFGVRKNIRHVLGNKWFIAWLFPFITSELPHNGIDWKTTSMSTEIMKDR